MRRLYPAPSPVESGSSPRFDALPAPEDVAGRVWETSSTSQETPGAMDARVGREARAQANHVFSTPDHTV